MPQTEESFLSGMGSDNSDEWETESDIVEGASDSTETDDTSDELEPYQFEPTISEGEDGCETDNESNTEEVDEIDEEDYRLKFTTRADASAWCLCGYCQPQLYQIECVCCRELQDTNAMVEDFRVVMVQSNFETKCREHLWKITQNGTDWTDTT